MNLFIIVALLVILTIVVCRREPERIVPHVFILPPVVDWSKMTPTPTPSVSNTEERLLELYACRRVRSFASLPWMQTYDATLSDDPRLQGSPSEEAHKLYTTREIEIEDRFRVLSRKPTNAKILVKVYPHDGRTVGQNDNMVWIEWTPRVTTYRFDLRGFACEE